MITTVEPSDAAIDAAYEAFRAHGKAVWTRRGIAVALAAAYAVEQSPPVHVVEVFDRTDGIYVFADLDDAIAFEDAVNRDSDTTFESRCFRREEVICNHEDTLKLIESERENS